MKKVHLVFLLFLLLTVTAESAAPKGHLFIIGGGKRSPEMMKQFVELAGGPEKARIVVFPMASGIADTVGIEQTASFRELGAKNSEFMILRHDQADSIEYVNRLTGVTGIFFSGGDQSRLTKALAGTAVLRKIKELYTAGAVIGGTSAGAAVMSAMMITGKELLHRDTVNAYTAIKAHNIETVEGFGFISNAIVDQHFIKRKRHNRLLSLVLEHPQLIGIGIDEATAIIVNPDETFTVIGDATVLVVDATRSTQVRTNTKGDLSAGNMSLHLLMAGDSFNLKSRKIIPRKVK